MRYFMMQQDVNLLYGIRIKSQESNLSKVFYLGGEGDETRPDFIETPVMMLSSELKRTLDLYEDDITY